MTQFYVLKQKEVEGEEAEAKMAFRPGMKLYGYCGGIFGRDSYDIKTIFEIHPKQIQVINSEGLYQTGNVSSWVKLLEDSNESLQWETYEDKCYDTD